MNNAASKPRRSLRLDWPGYTAKRSDVSHATSAEKGMDENDARLIPYKFALMDVWLEICSDVLKAQDADKITRDEVIDIVLDAERVERNGKLTREQLAVWNAQSQENQRALAEVVFWQPVYQ